MITRRRIEELSRLLQDRRVLSVVVDGRITDPAQTGAWRRAVDDRIGAVVDEWREAPREERRELEAAVERMRSVLPEHPDGLGGAGWVGFATSDAVECAELLPGPAPTSVAWGVGARIAPVLAAARDAAGAFVAIVDHTSAAVYHARGREVERRHLLHAHTPDMAVLHMGDTPRQGFHSGTRGHTGTDAGAVARIEARRRMTNELVARLAGTVGREDVIVVGGTPVAARETLTALEQHFALRVHLAAELGIAATEHEIAQAGMHGAALVREARDAALVARLIARAGAGERWVTELDRVRAALVEGGVRELLVSERALARAPELAEELMQATLAERGAVTVVGGEGAQALDTATGGIAAVLRFANAGQSAATSGAPAATLPR